MALKRYDFFKYYDYKTDGFIFNNKEIEENFFSFSDELDNEGKDILDIDMAYAVKDLSLERFVGYIDFDEKKHYLKWYKEYKKEKNNNSDNKKNESNNGYSLLLEALDNGPFVYNGGTKKNKLNISVESSKAKSYLSKLNKVGLITDEISLPKACEILAEEINDSELEELKKDTEDKLARITNDDIELYLRNPDLDPKSAMGIPESKTLVYSQKDNRYYLIDKSLITNKEYEYELTPTHGIEFWIKKRERYDIAYNERRALEGDKHKEVIEAKRKWRKTANGIISRKREREKRKNTPEQIEKNRQAGVEKRLKTMQSYYAKLALERKTKQLAEKELQAKVKIELKMALQFADVLYKTKLQEFIKDSGQLKTPIFNIDSNKIQKLDYEKLKIPVINDKDDLMESIETQSIIPIREPKNIFNPKAGMKYNSNNSYSFGYIKPDNRRSNYKGTYLQIVDLHSVKVSKKYILNRLYGCYIAASYFQILVSNTPIDEDYLTYYRRIVKKSKRVSMYEKDDSGNKTVKDAFKAAEEMNPTPVYRYHLVEHKADDVIVRADWILNFRGKNFKAFKSAPAPNSDSCQIDAVMNEDWFIKKDDADSMLNIALFLYNNTAKDNFGDYEPTDYSLYFSVTNINPRWQQLEYGHYENTLHDAPPNVGMNPKYGFEHGVTKNKFVYQAPMGFKRLTDALWTMQLETGRWKGYASRFIARNRPKLDVTNIDDKLYFKLKDIDPTIGTHDYVQDDIHKI